MADERDDTTSAPAPHPPITFHLTPLAVWIAQRNSAVYKPEPFDREGFIHCTDGEKRALDVGNRYYTGDSRPYCLLEIARARLTAPVVYEDTEQVYPHIYGPLDTAAIRAVRTVERDDAGRFIRFGERVTTL